MDFSTKLPTYLEMKSFVVFCIAVVAFEAVQGQVIRSFAPSIIGNCGCGGPIVAPIPSCPTPVIAPIPSYPTPYLPSIPTTILPVAQPSVANSLADTLSLLTVSSLLADTLPLGPTVLPSCGCGYNGYYY